MGRQVSAVLLTVWDSGRTPENSRTASRGLRNLLHARRFSLGKPEAHTMKQRYRLFRRGEGGRFYVHDGATGKQHTLGTSDRALALRLLHAQNEAERQPAINLQIARAYLAAADPAIGSRTWQAVIDKILKCHHGEGGRRWQRAVREKSFDSLRHVVLLETRPEHFLRVLRDGGVSTNNFLRRLHNFALDMGWLPLPVLPKRKWPAVRYRQKRAISKEEHLRIVAGERNVELRAYFWCCWHLGGAQGDVARLRAEDVDWESRVVSFFRSKTGSAQIVHFGPGLAEVLQELRRSGGLFPRLAAMDEKHRASLFQRACRRVKVEGVSLHSYRYAWAERAKRAGYPERFAQMALGHNSKAVHRAYAKKAHFSLPSLEEFENKSADTKVIPWPEGSVRGLMPAREGSEMAGQVAARAIFPANSGSNEPTLRSMAASDLRNR